MSRTHQRLAFTSAVAVRSLHRPAGRSPPWRHGWTNTAPAFVDRYEAFKTPYPKLSNAAEIRRRYDLRAVEGEEKVMVKFASIAMTLSLCFAAAAAAQEGQVFEGRFQPASTTAHAYTGAIEFTPDGIEADFGQKYVITPFGGILANVATGQGGPTFADLLGVDNETSITIHKVRSQIIPPSAPNGGYCDNEPTSFLAMVLVGQELRIAAFKGQLIDGSASFEELCGTYNYAR